MKMTPKRVVGLIAGLLFASFSPALAQSQNCLKVNCPPAGAPFVVPCEGPYGAENWFADLAAAITAGNPCNPTNPPVIISEAGYPTNMPIPLGEIVSACITYGFPGTSITQQCCVTITVGGCCGTNCIVLVCPGDTVVACNGPGGAVVNFGQAPYLPYLTNLCGSTVPTNFSVSLFPPVAGPTALSPGPHTFSACLKDSISGRKDCCCFTVVVTGPACPPATSTAANCDDILICPTNVTVCVTNNATASDVPLQFPTITNYCGHAITVTPIHSSVGANYVYPLGRTTVTTCISWIDESATEPTSTTNCCCYDVDVECCTNPPPCQTIIQCPGDQTYGCSPNGVVLDYNVYVTNTCEVITLVCDPPPGTRIFSTTNVCCYAETASGAVLTQCCFTIYVQPCPSNCAPVFPCPSNIFILCSGPRGSDVTYPVITPVDPCDPEPHVAFNPPPGSFFLPGCWPVTVTAWDYLGHTNSCVFKVCVLTNTCYLRNPSFEFMVAGAPPPLPCNEPVSDALYWNALSGSPMLFRTPAAVPNNCWGSISPCNGTNYAGLSGGYSSSGSFSTDQLIGQTIVPLARNGLYRLRACLSLAQISTGAVVFVEFALANRANPTAQQFVINQSAVTVKGAWQAIAPPCFQVPAANLPWDSLIIRAGQVSAAAGVIKYPVGEVYVDNVNLCCCRLIVINPIPTPVLNWTGIGTLQFLPSINVCNTWVNLGSQFTADPVTDLRSLTLTPSLLGGSPAGYFEVVAPEGDTTECGCYP